MTNTFPAYALDADRVDPVIRVIAEPVPGGYQVTLPDGRRSFRVHVWPTARDAATVANDLAHDLDL